jgi:hypothetical protein
MGQGSIFDTLGNNQQIGANKMECEIVVFKINPQAMNSLKAESISGLTQYDGKCCF